MFDVLTSVIEILYYNFMNFNIDSATYLQNKVASLEAMGVTQSVTNKGECRATGFARNAD